MIFHESSVQTNQPSNNQTPPILSTYIPQITKKALYNQLADVYYLPPCDSKGVSKKYLEAVQNGTCFRIKTIELKRFLAELKPSQTKRSLHANKSEAFIKLTALLNEMGYKPLNFGEDYVPDSEWLFNVLRYIDRCNTSRLFEKELTPLGSNDTDSIKILKVKKNAEQTEVTRKGLTENKKFCEQITKVTELHRRLISRKAEADILSKILETMKKSIKTDQTAIDDEVRNIVIGEKVRGRNLEAMKDEEIAELNNMAYM